jgi:hypothetical protein
MTDIFNPDEFKGGEAAYAPERLQMIGQVTSDWSLVEQNLEMALWKLVGIKGELGVCFTTDLGSVARVTIAKNLLNRFHKHQPYYDRLMLMLSLFDECRQARNTIAHSILVAGPETYATFTKTMKSGRGNIYVRIGLADEEIQVCSNAVGWLLCEINDAHRVLEGEPAPSHDQDFLPVFEELLRKLRQARQGSDLLHEPTVE